MNHHESVLKAMVTWSTILRKPQEFAKAFPWTWVWDGLDMNLESNARNKSLGFCDTTHRSSFSSVLLFCSLDDKTSLG